MCKMGLNFTEKNTDTCDCELTTIEKIINTVQCTYNPQRRTSTLFFCFFLFPIPSILQFLVSHFAVFYCTKMLSFLIDLVHFMSVPIINVIRKMFTNLFWPNIVSLSSIVLSALIHYIFMNFF